jgi:hypothetical protein
MWPGVPQIDELLARASQDDAGAVDELLASTPLILLSTRLPIRRASVTIPSLPTPATAALARGAR